MKPGGATSWPAAISPSRAIVVVLSMGIGLFSPPFGVGYYAASAISKSNPDAGMRPIAGYVGALIVGLAIIIIIPWISTGFL